MQSLDTYAAIARTRRNFVAMGTLLGAVAIEALTTGFASAQGGGGNNQGGAACDSLRAATIDKFDNAAEYEQLYGDLSATEPACAPILSFVGGRFALASRWRSAFRHSSIPARYSTTSAMIWKNERSGCSQRPWRHRRREFKI